MACAGSSPVLARSLCCRSGADGQAVVAGLQSELSVSELLAIAGSQVTEIGSAMGYAGSSSVMARRFKCFMQPRMGRG